MGQFRDQQEQKAIEQPQQDTGGAAEASNSQFADMMAQQARDRIEQITQRKQRQMAMGQAMLGGQQFDMNDIWSNMNNTFGLLQPGGRQSNQPLTWWEIAQKNSGPPPSFGQGGG